jgi:hypothetical protein
MKVVNTSVENGTSGVRIVRGESSVPNALQEYMVAFPKEQTD